MSEALNQDVEGKALVMLTILNRVNSDKFPNSIEEVVLAQNQFTTDIAICGIFFESENSSIALCA